MRNAKSRPGRHGTGPVDLVTGLTVGIFGRREPHVRRDRRTPLRMRQVVARSILGPVHGVQVARHRRCAHVVIQAVRRWAANSAVKYGPSEPRRRRRDHHGRGRRALKAESLYSCYGVTEIPNTEYGARFEITRRLNTLFVFTNSKGEAGGGGDNIDRRCIDDDDDEWNSDDGDQ